MPARRRPRHARAAVALLVATALVALLGTARPTLAAFVDAGAARVALASGSALDVPFAGLDAGGDHTLALTASGELYAWGGNAHGQLGDGTTTTRTAPVRVALPAGTEVTRFAAGVQVSVALSSSGTVYTWGSTDVTPGGPVPTPVAVPVAVQDVDAGGRFFLAWGSGELYSWGDNGSGRLGRGTVGQTYRQPDRVTASLLQLATVSTAAAGRYGGVAQTAPGALVSVRAWGENHSRALGTSIGGVPAPAGFAELEMGHDTKLGRTADGRLYFSYQTSAFVRQTDLSGAVLSASVSAADAYRAQTFAVVTDTQLYAWFDNTHGQYGDGTTLGQDTPRPVALAALGSPRLASAAAGPGFTLLLTTDGAYTGSGTNDAGQLGTGTTASRATFADPRPHRVWP